MLMIFTIIIAGRMTVITTASGDKTSSVDHKSEASGIQSRRFLLDLLMLREGKAQSHTLIRNVEVGHEATSLRNPVWAALADSCV